MIYSTQITLGAANTAVSATRVAVRSITVQNNSAHDVRVGDTNISSTKGYLLKTGGTPPAAVTFGSSAGVPSINLDQVFLFGTAADLIDVIYLR